MIIKDDAPPSVVFPDDYPIVLWVDHEGKANTWWNTRLAPRDVAYALADVVDSIITEFDLGEH